MRQFWQYVFCVEGVVEFPFVDGIRCEPLQHVTGESFACKIYCTCNDAVSEHQSLGKELLVVADYEQSVGQRIA